MQTALKLRSEWAAQVAETREPPVVARTAAVARILVSTREYDMMMQTAARRALSPAPIAVAYLVPPAHEQSARDLRLESEQWSLERRLVDPARPGGPCAAPDLETFARRSEYRGRESAVIAGLACQDKRRGGDAASAGVVVRALTRSMRKNAPPSARPDTGGLRLAGAAGPLGAYPRHATTLPDDPLERFAHFFKDDAFEEDAPFGRGEDVPAATVPLFDPSAYAMFRALAHMAERRGDAGADATVTAGEGGVRAGHVLHGPLADIPRPPPLPRLTRFELQRFHMPPGPGMRVCARGEGCLFNASAEHGYVGREFYTSEQPPPAGAPLGLCINCLLAQTRAQLERNVKTGFAPALPINTFTVLVGEQEYGTHCLLDKMIENRRTGVDGHYPRFDATLRTWKPIPHEWMAFYGIAGQPPGRKPHYWAETNMDFRRASVESTPSSVSPRAAPSSAARTDTSSSTSVSGPH